MKNILQKNIPLWVPLIVLVFFLVGGSFIFHYYRQTIFNYDLITTLSDGSRQKLQYGFWPELANADFFSKVKNGFINQEANFVEADLANMKITVYKDGEIAGEATILTKGKEGSWWETPSGLYKSEGKTKTAYSSFGHVYMPWSISFHGNFLIHGWPYYAGGEPVAQGYSGGCIRLDTTEAEKIFNLIDPGMPILVYEKDFSPDEFSYQRKMPNISAQAFLVADLRNNFVFLDKNKSEVLPIASLTKLITSLVAIEHINIEKEIFVFAPMLVETSKPRLKEGDIFSVYDLLYPLLMESSNESAKTLAYFLGENNFVNLMNNRAKTLGMNDTHFGDTSGALAEDVSTTEDLFQLAKYIYNNRRFVFDITNGKINNDLLGYPKFSDLDNFNILSEERGFVGGKVGLTEAAGETFLSVYEITIREEKRPIVFIGLNSEDNRADLNKMIEYVKNNFE